MYKVYCDDEIIYTSECPLPEYKLINPKLSLERNTPDVFEFTLPPCNLCYDKIECLVSWVEVYRDEELWFEGYVMTESTDFWKQKKIRCEGPLALLTRTTQPNAIRYFGSIRQYLDFLLEVHNSKVKNQREKFYIGSVTVFNTEMFGGRVTTTYDTTYNYVMNLVENYGGYLDISYDSEGRRYLNYYKDAVMTSSQQIVFGSNLMDYTKNYDRTELATVLVPLGMTKTQAKKKIDELNKVETKDEQGNVKTAESIAIEIAQQKFGFTKEEVKPRIYEKYKFNDADDILEKEVKYSEKREELYTKLAEQQDKLAAATKASERETIQKRIDSINKQIGDNDNNIQKLNEEKNKRWDFEELWTLRDEHVYNVAYEVLQGKWGKDETHIYNNLVDKGYNYEEILELREKIAEENPPPEEETGTVTPYGEEEIDGEMRISIAPANNGSPYLVSEAEKTYGWIEKVVVFEDEYTAEGLKAKGEDYLKNMQFDNMVLEISAFDLSYTNQKEV